MSFTGRFTFLFPAILLWGQSCLFLEKRTEAGRVRKIEIVGNLLDIFLCVFEQRDAFADDGLENQFLHGISADRLGHRREVFGRQAKLVCIEFYTALLHIMLFDQLNQADKVLIFVPYGFLLCNKLASVNGTEPVGLCQQEKFLLVPVECVFHRQGGIQQ